MLKPHEEYPELYQFLQGYFHQDAEGEDLEIAAKFARDQVNCPEDLYTTLVEIETLLAKDDAEVTRICRAMVDQSEMTLGVPPREWLMRMRDQVLETWDEVQRELQNEI